MQGPFIGACSPIFAISHRAVKKKEISHRIHPSAARPSSVRPAALRPVLTDGSALSGFFPS